MAVATSITVSGTVTGLPEGSNTLAFTYTNSNAPGSRQLLNLTSTLVAVTIPSNTLFIVIVPPAANTEPLEIAGDNVAGVKLHPTNPTILPVPSTSPVLYLGTVTSSVNSVQLYFI